MIPVLSIRMLAVTQEVAYDFRTHFRDFLLTKFCIVS